MVPTVLNGMPWESLSCNLRLGPGGKLAEQLENSSEIRGGRGCLSEELIDASLFGMTTPLVEDALLLLKLHLIPPVLPQTPYRAETAVGAAHALCVPLQAGALAA